MEPTVIIAAIIAAVAAIISAIISHKSGRATREAVDRQRSEDYRIRQLNELYGPMHVLRKESKSLWRQLPPDDHPEPGVTKWKLIDHIEEIKAELDADNIEFDRDTPVGGMIEVPAAAICADIFANHLDFLSIGTNDLIQYTIAIDRVNDEVNYLYDPLHPAVLRLINITLQAGEKANIPVAMCGEMAGESQYAALLLGLGLRQFSVHPASLLELKKIISETSIDELAEFTRQALAANSGVDVAALVERQNRKVH